MELLKNTSGQFLYAVVVAETAGTAVTSGVTCHLSLDGAAYADATNTETHLGNGLWRVELTAAETNADEVGYVFENSGTAMPVGGMFTTHTLRSNAYADQVWDEVASGHTTASTFGKYLGDQGSATTAAIADAVWDEAVAGHTTADTYGKYVGDQGSTSAAAIADAVWDEAASGHTTAGTFGKYLGDQGSLTNATIADAVWDEATSGHAVSGSFGERVDATITSRAAASTALDNTTWTDTRAGYLDNLDAAVTSRAPAATALSTATWTGTRAGYLDNLDAAISSRSSHSAANVWSVGTRELTSVPNVTVGTISSGAITSTAIHANAIAAIADGVWDEAASGHTTAGTYGKYLGDQGSATAASIADAVWDEAQSGHTTEGTFGEYLDAVVSDISPPSAASIADAVWDEAQSGHTTEGTFGEFLDAVVSEVSTPSAASIADAVWDEATSGHVSAGTYGAYYATLASNLTSTRIGYLDNLDAAVSTRSSHNAAAVWSASGRTLTAATNITAGIADAVWDEAYGGHTTSNTFGEYWNSLVTNLTSTRMGYLDNLDAAVSSRSSHNAAAVWSSGTRTLSAATNISGSIADAVWDEAASGHTTAGTYGKYLGDQGSATAASIADAVWDEVQSGHTTEGTFGEYLDAIVSEVSTPTAAAIADAVWDEDQADHTTEGTFGEYLDAVVSELSLPTAGAIADAVWDEAVSAHTTAGTYGAYYETLSGALTSTRIGYLDRLDAAISTRSSHNAAAVWSSGTRTLSAATNITAGIADAVWDEAQSGHTTEGTFGEYLDAVVSTRSSHTAANVWSVATRALTTGVDLTTGAVDAIWDEDLTAHSTSGSAGAILDDLDGLTDESIADQVWDEVASGHTTAGTFGAVVSA